MESLDEMFTIDCPICEGDASVNASLDTVDCDGCGTTTAIVPDPTAPALDLAA